MKKVSRSICILISVMLVFSLFVGCNITQDTSGNDKTSTAKDGVKSKKPDIIRAAEQQISERAVDRTTYLDELLEERLNIKISKTAIPGDTFQEKQSVMMASGSLDILTLPPNLYYENAKKGYLLDLTDIIPEKMPNYNKILSEDMKKALSVSGVIYGVNQVPKKATVESGVADITHTRIALRTDWLEELNLEIPETMDDIYDIAKAFYNADIDGVGKDNLAIITACNGFSYRNLEWLFGAFGVMNNVWYVDDNQNVLSYDVDPRMKEVIEWLRMVYKEDLLDKDFITQKEPQMKDKIQNDKVGIWGGHWGVHFAVPWPAEHEEMKLRASGQLKPDQEYKRDNSKPYEFWQMVKPPTGPRGEWGTKTDAGIRIYPKSIPKNASKNAIEAVYRYWDYISTEEGGMLGSYGIEGEDYILSDELGPQAGPKVGDQDYNQYRYDQGFSVDQIWHPSIKYAWGTDLAQRSLAFGSYGGEMVVKKGMEWARPQYIDALAKHALTGSKEAGQLKAKVESMADEYWSKMIVGEYGMEKWDEFVERWHKEGGQQLIDEYTAEYKSLK